MSSELLYHVEQLLIAHKEDDRPFCEAYINSAVGSTLITESQAKYVWYLVFQEDPPLKQKQEVAQ